MLHDRDEKYEGSDEPEYHFSDEEGGDYTDADIPKDAASSPDEPRTGGPEKRLAPSKRMMISLVVFLILVYVVYKMVAPTSPVPATDITAPVTQQATTQMSKTPIAATTKSVTMAAAPVTTQATAPAPAPIMQQTIVAPQAAPSMPQPTTAPMTGPTAAAAMPVQGQPVIPVGQPPVMAQPPVAAPLPPSPMAAPAGQTIEQPVVAQTQAMSPSPPPSTVQPPAPVAAPLPPSAMATPAAQAVAQPPMTVQPSVTSPPSQSMPQQGAVIAQQPVTSPAVGIPSVIPVPLPVLSQTSKMAALEADSARLMSQVQADYAQKLNDFATQNKALQEQVQTLNSRISTMETQLNQLVQALTRQNAESQTILPVEESSTEQKISYNVQAIIPGRAWLKSNNGETLTVAEGDVIKSLGRVMKIDPYDGIVEINTGNKTVSLSYGTGA